MTSEREAIAEAAAVWHVASAREDMDWNAFEAWLAADPRHVAIYDEVALADALVIDHRDALRPDGAIQEAEPSDVVRRVRTWRWVGGAAAAVLAIGIAVPQMIATRATEYATQGTSRTIALDAGSQVVLAPRSRLAVKGESLALSGGAWFDIRHNPNRHLTITADNVTVSDIGTRFDMQVTSRGVRVEVADGVVSVSGAALEAPVRIAAGRAFTYDIGGRRAAVTRVQLADVGEWRDGRLTYSQAPLALVAADLSRYAGVAVTAGPTVSEREFSGTLTLGDGEAAVRDLSQLMGLDLHRDANGDYRLDASR